ncbi:MAG TPA: MlaD family protein [Solirubrobacteraceae bacterium]|nr:MlaD family protein [Solirubrobacteraceae bacterium]
MRTAVPVAAVLIVAAVVALFLVTREEDEAYRVRAIFDNAGFIIPGEDVKVAGVKVGSVEDVEVTPEFKAAVVLAIDDEGYQDFRADASCIVRPQSLIGEKYIECEPTQKRGVGAEPPGELRRIEDGPGEGQRLLPVENTERSVDLDLINGIMREPYRERLSIIVNELGIGLAGRGEDLDDVIRRANPALREVDEVLRLLAKQNDQLERLAVDGDTILQPLARERRHVSSAIGNMSAVAEATAERRADLEANIERLPRFLRELRPTMTRLGALSDEMTPVLSDLGDVAPDINRFLLELGPFSQAGIPALDSAGEAGKIGTPAVRNSLPVVRDLRTFAGAARPLGETLADVLVSFERNDGIERAMDYIFFQAAAVNGFDSFGHYLRAGLLVNQCSTYAVNPVGGCSANFRKQATASAAGASSLPRDPVLAWTARMLQGLDPTRPRSGELGRHGSGEAGTRRRAGAGGAPAPAATPAPAPAQPAPAPSPQPADPAATATPAPSGGDPGVPLLDYLFGGGG